MVSEAQKKAVKKYTEKLDDIRFRVPKGEGDLFKAHAEKMGESLASFLRRAAKEAIERDTAKE